MKEKRSRNKDGYRGILRIRQDRNIPKERSTVLLSASFALQRHLQELAEDYHYLD